MLKLIFEFSKSLLLSLLYWSCVRSELKIWLFFLIFSKPNIDRFQQAVPASIIKGTVSRDGNFFKGLNILISTFCVCADAFQGLYKAFHYPIQLLTFN
jgi:hypothetical protein